MKITNIDDVCPDCREFMEEHQKEKMRRAWDINSWPPEQKQAWQETQREQNIKMKRAFDLMMATKRSAPAGTMNTRDALLDALQCSLIEQGMESDEEG